MTNARSKPCRHCLYSKNHLGTPERAMEMKGALAAGVIEKFYCHEHIAKTLCNGFCRKHPERVPSGAKFSQANGELKSEYAHKRKEDLTACGNNYLGFGK